MTIEIKFVFTNKVAIVCAKSNRNISTFIFLLFWLMWPERGGGAAIGFSGFFFFLFEVFNFCLFIYATVCLSLVKV